MLGALLIIGFLIACGLTGYYLFTGIFSLFFPPDKYDSKSSTYIDKSVHHHYHDNRTLNITDKDSNLHTISKKAHELNKGDSEEI